jgi:hypothetical protein
MEVIALKIPAGMYVGNADHHIKTGEDTIYYVVADSLAAAQDVLTSFLGAHASESFSFTTKQVNLSEALKNSFEQSQKDREVGYATAEEKHIRRLLDRISLDLGSIVIDRMFFVISNEGKQLIGVRIEAHEGDRRRVVYLEDQRDALTNLKPEAIIHALEEKF